jgi:hypothetical protein
MQRLGYVLFLLVICWHFNIKKNIRQSFILDFSRESLLVYWLHLTIIFAVIFNGKNLELIFNYRFGIWECILATVILVLVMVIVSKLWGWFKRNYKRQSKYVVIATISVGFFLFIIL